MSRLYVGRLSHRAQERDLERFFKGFGRIRDIMLKNGYAFVEFEDYRDADDALYELNGQTLCGERVAIEHAKGTPHGEDLRRDLEKGINYPSKGRAREDRYVAPRRSPPSGYKLIVENLSSRCTWQDLKDMMKKVGEVVYVDAHNDRKNEGVIEFATRRDMEKAMDKFDGMDLYGRKLKLSEHRKNRARSYSRSRSHSRSRRTSKRHASKSLSRSHSKRRSHDDEDEEEEVDKNKDEEKAKSRSASADSIKGNHNGNKDANEEEDDDDD